MKPINSKDLPKVILLGVGTVGMLGFFTMTLMGAAKKKETPSSPAPTPAAGTTLVAASVPAPGTAVGTAMGSVPSGPIVAINDPGIEFGGPSEPFRKVLPDPSAINPFPRIRMPRLPRMTGNLNVGAFPTGNFGGRLSSGGSISPAAVIEPVLRLDGVVADGRAFALISCAGRTDMYPLGARIAGLFEIIGINESGASFRGPKGIFRLEVGEEHAPAPATATPPAGDRVLEGNLEQVAEHNPVLPLPR